MTLQRLAEQALGAHRAAPRSARRELRAQEEGGEARGLGVRRQHVDSRGLERGGLGAEALGIGLGADDRGDDRERASRARGAAARASRTAAASGRAGSGWAARPSTRSTAARRRPARAPAARTRASRAAGIDHGMRPADRELVGAEVDDLVTLPPAAVPSGPRSGSSSRRASCARVPPV